MHTHKSQKIPILCGKFIILLFDPELLDELISQLISSLKEKDENILAIYTAHHASWVRFISIIFKTCKNSMYM